MKHGVFILVLALVAVSVQATVYQYTNKQGKTSYSDTPQQGAKKIDVPPVMTYEPPKLSKQPAKQFIEQPQAAYQTLTILSPAHESTVRMEQLPVTYVLEPSLNEGDMLVLYVDNIKQEGLFINALDRGQHTIRLEIRGVLGKVLLASPEHVIYSQRSSVFSPSRNNQ